MMDHDQDGLLTRAQLCKLTEAMHRSLGNVQLIVGNDPEYFTGRIFHFLFLMPFFLTRKDIFPKHLQTINLPQYRVFP